MDRFPPAAGTAYFVRWWTHLIVLASYPLTLGILGYSVSKDHNGPMLPNTAGAVLAAVGLELVIFAVVFAVAVIASGARADELLLRWRGRLRPVWRGFFYSLFLRLAVVFAIVLVAAAARLASKSAWAIEHLRPEVENVVDAQALADPLYFALTLTVISFVVAGFREELWRAGMLAALLALFPRFFEASAGRWAAAGIVGIVFGVGHLTQGPGGVLVTALLGLGLGLIVLRHQSIWDAVFAHGFFNAATFAALYWMVRFHPDALG